MLDLHDMLPSKSRLWLKVWKEGKKEEGGGKEKSGEKRVKRVGNSSNYHTHSPFEFLEHLELWQLM